METLQSRMEGIYGAGKVCLDSASQCLGLEPDLEDILAESRDYDRLLAVWKGWRNVTGPKMKSLYQEFVALSNEGVRELGYADTGEYWRSFYESDTFQADLENLLQQLSPLYTQLHAYVRSKLIGVYGRDRFPETGHIPAHLFGNMWAQQWNNIYSLLEPYTNRTAIDVTTAMHSKGYTVKKMFQTAEDFFKSLGFEPMPDTFWAGTIMEKPADRDIVCHASAWDFYNAKDFRIKMCTSVNQEDLVTIHHEMGHIQYFLQYRHQPQVFRDGANPGFHEAVGDTIALSVSTPAHLRKIGLLAEGEDNYLDEINFLLKMALEKVAFLPFGYLIDQWRWSVFSGETDPDHYNDKWWQLRCRYQGISPPTVRSEADFDPGAKYHIPGNTPYIRYFASFVLQFQFQQALCRAAGHQGALHHCDVYHSDPAGQRLRSMLSKGASRPWPEVLEELTGSRRMDAGALLEYFKPLHLWLERENARERLGWTRQCPDDDQLRRANAEPLPTNGERTASTVRTRRSTSVRPTPPAAGPVSSSPSDGASPSTTHGPSSGGGFVGGQFAVVLAVMCLSFVLNRGLYV